jgi:catechol 2,3-dioxygenase-like lactoylglutathione lyase family enzyme
MMRLEHIAFNVHDPAELSAWYESNCGMTVRRRAGPPLFPHFLVDEAGLSLLEFYRNPDVPLPDYPAVDPYTHHIAFAVSDIAATLERLCATGATAIDTIKPNPAGDLAVFLRDPWGLPLQLVQRGKPLL